MKTNANESPTPNQDLDLAKLGLTKREYFAALAMQGLLASETEDWTTSAKGTAKASVEYADALIAELSKMEGGA